MLYMIFNEGYTASSGSALQRVELTAEDTDWNQILVLYDLLERVAPGPMVTLNRIVAAAMVDGLRDGLERLAAAESQPALAGHDRVDAVRAHLLDMAGDHGPAPAHYPSPRAAR